MSDYTRTTNFTAKDSLSSGDPAKKVKGAEIDNELDAIAAASTTKANKLVPTTPDTLALLSAAGDLVDGGETIAEVKQAGGASAIPAGTKMLFLQVAAPTGWTQDNTVNDRVLRLVDNTGTGAATGGSWTISGLSVQGHTLTTDEIPSHTHGYWYAGNGTSASSVNGLGGGDIYHNQLISAGSSQISSTGGSNSHTHNMTIADTWRPAYVDAIVCTKDAY